MKIPINDQGLNSVFCKVMQKKSVDVKYSYGINI